VVILTGLAPENQDRLNQSIPPSLECIYLASQDDPAELLLEADLAMVAGGITLYEAACLGTPALVVSHNELQQVTASRFDALGISRNLGLASALSSSQMEEAVLKLAGDVGLRAKMGAYGRELVDGRGAERIEELIRRLCVSMEKSTGNEKSHAQL
jgi:spore coat polysaccharide biosynthesis predicted glycosyltransferase SpsG